MCFTADPTADIQKALKAVDLMKILDGQVAIGNKSNSKTIGEHKFWKTQPVPQTLSGSSFAMMAMEEGPIDPIKTVEEVRQEPLPLPSGFEWSLIDIKNDVQCEEVYSLLSENYVEDDDAMFRFRYSKEFLLWSALTFRSLTAPGYHPDWHIGVRVQKTGKLVAFISGILVDIRVRSKTFPSAEINFLCVHKKLRAKRLTPVLIKEVTRRVNLRGVWQAIYTAGIVLPTPIGTSRYYHRNLNPPKLVDIGFSSLPRSMTIARLVKQLAVPTAPSLPGFREMEKKDVPQVAALLRRYLARFEITQTFETDQEVEHWFLSGRGKEGGEEGSAKWRREGQVVWAYVVEDPTTHVITDMISFYSLPSSIMKHPTHRILNAAYLYYYASDSIFRPSSGGSEAVAESSASVGIVEERKRRERLGARLVQLSGDLMVVAKNAGFDVLNALTLLDNNMFLSEQKASCQSLPFGAGDGFLVNYLYNWQCAPIDGGLKGTSMKQGAGIGVVML
ncbi:Glycylpeptide N-tetradecanoyltransferase [Dioszegia hungarica]|uniref:Glycylpeptide N-tetradecanoyltransferase n=1 Tax=Dioszegia hungarica TaxID=4972 RepID=A0AA38H914_9TREE|nr:Glycylpeptide N-tetradecanoyltransferase [Dioszegia hungarica]KAI9634584.1 Glycylpeptide N-tetradecanoyltransferase [Dioszegia hungarica]